MRIYMNRVTDEARSELQQTGEVVSLIGGADVVLELVAKRP